MTADYSYEVSNLVEVSCLGNVRLAVNSEDLNLGPGQRVLLAILVAAGRAGLTKAQLYEEIFADNPQKSREQTAVMRVQRLRSKISTNGDGLRAITNGPRYALATACCSVDVWALEDAVVSDDSDAIISALRNWSEPYQGLNEDPKIVVTGREQIRRRYRAALAKVGWRITPGYGEDVLTRILEELGVVPFDETLTASGAAALYRLGRQPDALHLIKTCRDALLDGHGLDAGPTLDGLELAILNHDESVIAGQPSRTISSTDSFAPAGLLSMAPDRFVGRQRSMTLLTDAITKIGSGGQRPGSILLIRGDAGCGKTSVLANVLAPLSSSKFTVRVGGAQGSNQRAIAAYQPFVQALPEVSGAFESFIRSSDPDSARLQFWHRVNTHLREIAERGPCVLALEDVHDFDSQSLALLRHLASTAQHSNLLILASTRPVDLGISEVSDTVGVIDLEPLTSQDVRDLLALDHPNESPITRDRYAERVLQVSDGNALVVSVLSRDAPTGLNLLGLPTMTTVEETLAHHLSAKVDDPMVEQVLSVAALVGIEFDPELVSEVVDMKATDVTSLIAGSGLREICAPRPNGMWRFDHYLTVNYFANRIHLYRSMFFARLARRARHQGPDLVRYVIGAGDELDPSFAVPMLLDEAEGLENTMSFAEAATALAYARSLLDDGDERLLSLLVRLAACATRSGAIDDAVAFRREAFDLACRDDDPQSMFDAAMAGLPSGEFAGGEKDRLKMLDQVPADRLTSTSAAGFARWRLRLARLCDRPDVARHVIDTIHEEWATDDSDDWSMLRTEQLSFQSATSRAMPIRAELEALVEGTRSATQRAALLHRTLIAALVEQDPDAVSTVFDRAAAAARADGSPRIRWAMDVLAATLNGIGMRDSHVDLEAARISGLRWGIPDVYDNWGVQVWIEAWLAGRFGDALALIDNSRGSIADNVAWHAGEALCAAHTGDLDRARRECVATSARIVDNPDGTWTPIAAPLLIEASAVIGDHAAATAGRDALRARSGQAIVLGFGTAHLGPADRYLAVAAELLGDEDPEPLRAASFEQAARSGAALWMRPSTKSS